MDDREPAIYIMTNKTNTVLYTGSSGYGLERIDQHKRKLVEGFTKKYNLTKLVYFEPCETVEQALERERQIKNWHRQWKIELIEKYNPEWKDLYEEFVKRS
ncbi:MAG: GIY-YIG nuclease family protein [Candidatus Doudnabacteria bacterium]|nr:GIY-YIG nuclease family protein [Candidatus Doudnabacteria bacterium]